LFSSCNVGFEILVSNSSTCLGIDNLSTFESKVDSSDMKLKCNGKELYGKVGLFPWLYGKPGKHEVANQLARSAKQLMH
jgi:hypothetical protein